MERNGSARFGTTARRYRLIPLATETTQSGRAARGAVITGASGGLGREIARMLARRGFAVHVTDIRANAAATLAAELGDPAFASALDVRDLEACRDVVEKTVRRTGSLFTWVNNAGTLEPGCAWELDDAARREMLDVNFLGVVNGTLAALEVMRPARVGHVITVSSIAALTAAPGAAIYAASKHAALAFSLSTLLDLRRAGERNVELSCLCPDGIWTPMTERLLDEPNAAASFAGAMLLPGEVADRVGDLLDRPRAVASMPRSSGAVARFLDLSPRSARLTIDLIFLLGRLRQRSLRRKVTRGSWPPTLPGRYGSERRAPARR